MFRKTDLLNDHLRERFYVTPGHNVPPFTGILIGIAKSNLEFGDIRVNGQPGEGSLFVERHPGLYLQTVNDATG